MDQLNDFLPNNYEVPEPPAKYFKPVQGDNQIRILSSAIVGYEGWLDSNGKRTSVRKPMVNGQRPEFSMTEISDPMEIKHFMAFFVWNYTDKLVQVYQVTQKSIQQEITKLAKNPEWGSPKEYDLVISKSGEKLGTEYGVLPIPKKPLAPEIVEAWAAIQPKADLTRIFSNGDAFGEQQAA